jgi:electron transfer flavoprotein beta subunit
VLAPVLTGLGAELVLTGVQTPEDLLGQLAPYLGVRLGWPHVSAVSGVGGKGNGTVGVQQEYSGGVSATLELTLPAVIGVQAATHPPRYVSGSKLRQVMNSDAIKTSAGGEASAAPLAEVVAFAQPEQGQGAQMLDGDPEEVAAGIVAALSDRGLLKG